MAIPSGHFKTLQAQRMFAPAVTEIARIADLELRANITRISQLPLSAKFGLGLLVASYANQQQITKHKHNRMFAFRGVV